MRRQSRSVVEAQLVLGFVEWDDFVDYEEVFLAVAKAHSNFAAGELYPVVAESDFVWRLSRSVVEAQVVLVFVEQDDFADSEELFQVAVDLQSSFAEEVYQAFVESTSDLAEAQQQLAVEEQLQLVFVD